MSIIDIIIIVAGVIIVGLYLFLKLKQLNKFKKLYQDYINHGLTPVEAKEKATNEVYKKKNKNKETTNDTIYED